MTIPKSLQETQRLILLEECLRADYAHRKLHRRAMEILTVGKKIAWTRGGCRQIGEMVCLGGIPGNTRLLVRNNRSGKTYSISIHDYLDTEQFGLE